MAAERDLPFFTRFPWWFWFGLLLPFGLGSWAPIVPGARRRRPLWIGLGVLGIACFTLAVALDPVTDDAFSGLMIIAAWIVSGASVIGIREPYLDATYGGGFVADIEAAQERLQERREALALAVGDPALAAEVGIGRPDLPGARHAGLIDVNHVPIDHLATLPGFDPALARRAAEIRRDINGFANVADLGAVLDLDGNHVERLRDRVVFLPR